MKQHFKWDLFISHSRADEKIAESLAHELRELAFLTWGGLTTKQKSSKQIADAMEESAVCIVLFGQGSTPCWDDSVCEAIIARTRRTDGTFRVIPIIFPKVVSAGLDIKVSECESLCSERAPDTFIHFENGTDDELAIQQLVLRIRGVDQRETKKWTAGSFRLATRVRAKNAFDIDWAALMSNQSVKKDDELIPAPSTVTFLDDDEIARSLAPFGGERTHYFQISDSENVSREAIQNWKPKQQHICLSDDNRVKLETQFFDAYRSIDYALISGVIQDIHRSMLVLHSSVQDKQEPDKEQSIRVMPGYTNLGQCSGAIQRMTDVWPSAKDGTLTGEIITATNGQQVEMSALPVPLFVSKGHFVVSSCHERVFETHDHFLDSLSNSVVEECEDQFGQDVPFDERRQYNSYVLGSGVEGVLCVFLAASDCSKVMSRTKTPTKHDTRTFPCGNTDLELMTHHRNFEAGLFSLPKQMSNYKKALHLKCTQYRGANAYLYCSQLAEEWLVIKRLQEALANESDGLQTILGGANELRIFWLAVT